MNTARSIIIGCSLIAASVLVQLGYSIHRDQVAAEQRRQELDQTRKVQADAYRATQSKVAWDRAIRGLDYDLEHWIESLAPLRKGEYIKLDTVVIKAFNFSDVQWLDDRHIRVNGYISAQGKRTEQWCSWSKNMFLTDDGSWAYPTNAAFASVTPTKAQEDSWLVFGIRIQGVSKF